jgi:hypothetical protein
VLLACLLLLLTGGAMAVAQTAAAASFPTTESLDTFERAAENPLSDGGKWTKFAWAKTIGRVYSATYGWVPKEGGAEAPESEADGAYWNVREFSGPAVSVHMDAENLHDYVALWCDSTGAGSKNGYRLRVVGLAKSYGFKLVLEKWVSGNKTVLGESSEVAFKGLSSENVIGITATAGKVQAWYGTTEAGMSVKVEASDSTFTHGYVGLEGTNDDAYGETQYRAASSVFPATESLDTLERAAENPLSDGGKWSKLAWGKTIGRVYSEKYGWVPKEGGLEAPESEADGAYWNVREFTGPSVSVHMYAENRHDYVALWCDTTGAGSKNGYRLKIVGTATSYGFKLILEKWVSGTRTQLAESAEILFKGASSENIVGITASGGRIEAWYGTTEATLAVKAEASDATFRHGYVGIEGTDDSAFGETKYRAAGNEKEEREAKPSNTVRPTITGPHTYGKEETATHGTWTGTEPITYTYQWERCEGSACTAISGATSSTYVAAEADIGKTLRVKVTATNAFGASSEVSEVSGTVTGPPFNTTLPEITGQATEWHYEHASLGDWTGTPTEYTYQWYLCDPGCIPIEGTSGSTGSNAGVYKDVESPSEVGKTLMIKVTATNAYGSGVVFSNPSPTLTANACGLTADETELGSPHHCYGIAVWPYENLGVTSNIRTFFASVPVPSEDFVNNEMWDDFARGGWIEAGDKAGAGADGDVGFAYFTAQKIPSGYETAGYYEYDFSFGPGADNWFEDTLHAAGGGVWYIYLAGKHEWSWGSQPGVAAYAEDGMEATNDNIYASGQSMNMSYWSATSGQLVEGWSGDSPYTRGSGCITLTGDTSESFSNECGPQAPAESLTTASPPTTASPSTRGTNNTEPQAVALGAARSAGDPSPTELQTVKTTAIAGATTLSPPGSEAPTENAAARATLNKKADLVVLHGHFTLSSASVPRGASAPTGSVLSLVVDEETGAIVFTALTNRAPSAHSLEALGQVGDIADPASAPSQF